MFSRLLKNIFKETTNISDISPVTFNSPGAYNPRYGKQHGAISGKAQDGSSTSGFYYDNSYQTQDQVWYSPVFHPASTNENIIAGPSIAYGGTLYWNTTSDANEYPYTTFLSLNTYTTYNTYSEVVINTGYAYSPGNSSWGGFRHQSYLTAVAFNPGNTQNAPYNSPLGTNVGMYIAQLRPNGVDVYGTFYSANPSQFPPSGFTYYNNYYVNGDYDMLTVFNTAIAGTWNAPNVYGAHRLTYSNTYYSVYRTNAWTELGSFAGNYQWTYHPGTQGTNSPVVNTGSSYNAFGVSFPGGYGSAAPTVPVTPVLLPKYGSSTTNITIPSGGYVTITFKI